MQRITNLEINDSIFGLSSDIIELQRITNLEINDSTFGLSSDMIHLITGGMPDFNSKNVLLMNTTNYYKLTKG